MPVTIAVKRVGPNKPRIGTKYTNAGSVCPASRNGRKTRSALSLRPVQIPRAIPIIIVNKQPTIVCVRVSMASYQRPETTIAIAKTKARIAVRRPPMIKAKATIIATVTYHGDADSCTSSGLRIE